MSNCTQAKKEIIKICIWSDGTWCLFEDVEAYSFMSDDYDVCNLSCDIDPDEYVEEFLGGELARLPSLICLSSKKNEFELCL